MKTLVRIFMRAVVCCALVTMANAADTATIDRGALDLAFGQLAQSQWDGPQKPWDLIDRAIVVSVGDATARADLEKRLVSLVQGQATLPAKDFACRRLASIGTAQTATALAPLLTDRELSHRARYALQRIPDMSAAQALRDALPRVQGVLKAGVINSLAARRDAASLPQVRSLVSDADPQVARAAIAALGQIGGRQAVSALAAGLASSTDAQRMFLEDALLAAAETALREGHAELAARAYRLIEKASEERFRCAALAGLVAALPNEAAGRLKQALGDSELSVRGVAVQLIRDTKHSELIDALASAAQQLPPLAQQSLLEAFSSRMEPSALAAVHSALQSGDDNVRSAAIGSLGSIGRADDVATLVDRLSGAKNDRQREAVLQSLRTIRGADASAAIAAQLSRREPATAGQLVLVIVKREDASSAGALLQAAGSGDPALRLASFKALQELAGYSYAPALVALLAKSPQGELRDAAQQAVVLACMKAPDPNRRAEPILSAIQNADPAARCALLPALGMLGGPAAREVVWAAIRDPSPAVQEAGAKALANWPDASVAPDLLKLSAEAKTPEQRAAAVLGLARVAPRPGHLPPDKAFEYLKTAMERADSIETKRYVLTRMAPVRTPQCLAFVLTYADDPRLQAESLSSVAKIADALKESHPAVARSALERVLKTTTNETLRDDVEKILTRMKWKGK